uniref:Uncharacterized protein n=1 Tax=Cacopsylla melanoneura TaxID=428564 RepID=A0A8D9AWI3_9HEMI
MKLLCPEVNCQYLKEVPRMKIPSPKKISRKFYRPKIPWRKLTTNLNEFSKINKIRALHMTMMRLWWRKVQLSFSRKFLRMEFKILLSKIFCYPVLQGMEENHLRATMWMIPRLHPLRNRLKDPTLHRLRSTV